MAANHDLFYNLEDDEPINPRSLLKELEDKINEDDYAPASTEAVPEADDDDEVLSLRSSADSLDSQLRKNMFGYTKSSVEDYVDQLNLSAEQMQNNLTKQIKSLSSLCSKLTSESNVLREQLVKVDKERSQAQEDLLNANSDREETERKLKVLSVEKEEAEQRAAEACAEKEEAEQRIAAVYSEKDDMIRQIEAMQAERDQYMQLVEAAQTERNGFEQQISDICAEKNAAEEKVAAAFSEIETLNSKIGELSTASEQLELLKQKYMENSDELNNAQQKIRQQEDLLQDFASKLDSANEEMNGLRDLALSPISASPEEVEALNAEIDKLKSANARMASQASESQKQYTEVEGKLKEMLRVNTLMKDKMDSLADALVASQSEKEQLQKMYAEKASLMDSMSGELRQTQDELSSKDNMSSELLDAMKEEVRKAVEAKKVLDQNYSKLYDQYKKSLARAESLATEKEAISELLGRYQAKEQEYALIRKRSEENKGVIEDQSNVLTSILAEMENQLKLFNQLSDTNEENKKMICKLSREKADLQMQNIELREKEEKLTKQLTIMEHDSLLMSLQANQKSAPQVQPEVAAAEEIDSSFDFEADDEKTSFSEAIKKAREISRIFAMNSGSADKNEN